jgi:hypothetical protein
VSELVVGQGLVVGCSGLNAVLVLRNLDTCEGLKNTHYNPLHPLQGGNAEQALQTAQDDADAEGNATPGGNKTLADLKSEAFDDRTPRGARHSPTSTTLVIAYALRPLAAWAVHGRATGPRGRSRGAQAPEAGLDVKLPSSDEWSPEAGPLTPALAKGQVSRGGGKR